MGRLVALLLAPCLLVPTSAAAYTFATDTGDDTGAALSWLDEGPIDFRLHHRGGADLPAWLLHAAARDAFATWAEVAEADVNFEEGPAFTGIPCPHAVPEEYADRIPEACGTNEPPEHDYLSALYFMEAAWPFGTEVIALTTLSWAEGARLVDADISFNAVDYRWSVFDDQVLVDYPSIAVHEIGHFLGLGHSDVPGAVMRIDYEEGTTFREVGQDDIDGLAVLYPCADPPCLGTVGHAEGSSCQASGGGAAGLLGCLLVLGVAVAARRRWTRAPAAATVLALGLLLPTQVTSSTVIGLSVHDLAAHSDRVVRARVEGVTPYADRLVRSRVELRVLEDLRGDGPDQILLDQPGGTLADRGTVVFGMPRFEDGQEVVLFLDGDAPLGTRVVGLAQGAFTVLGDGALTRDTSGLMLARVGDGPPTVLEAPDRLEDLRAALR